MQVWYNCCGSAKVLIVVQCFSIYLLVHLHSSGEHGLSIEVVLLYYGLSGSFGCGVFHIKWPENWHAIHIELVPIVIAAALWGDLVGSMCTHFQSDNMAVVDSEVTVLSYMY